MESRVRHPVPQSRCYPLEYGYEGRYSLPTVRQPLQESTGNAQHGNLPASRPSYAQHLDVFNNIVRPSIHTPPIIPTQSLPSVYSSSPSPSSYHRIQQCGQFQQQQNPCRRPGINPLCLSRQFQQYRTKQAQKEDKSDQTWPDVLEDAFLDALLLIPHMGRKKYGMNQKQCGRNMLITDYLWIAYCESLPPGTLPDPKMKRHRKQVSSHIQVLKGFFRHHPMYHIFFSKEEKRDDKARDTVETGSLKDHPVLRALAEGRLPDERPNYDYFAQLLAFESQITVKPKRCWIFVAHNDVAVRADGSGYNPATGEELSEDDYPHLRENLVKDSWPREDKAMLPGTLLHRFTKMLEQVESSSVREIGAQWAADFPELATRLEAATAGDGGGTDGRACCDILHMHLTLEMQRRRHFPAQSELNSWVEINVEQPRLLNHRWKVVTRLARPAELSRGGSGSGGSSNTGGTLYETSAEMGVQYVHQPRCEGPISGQACDCIGQSQRQVVSVPFPADVWARTLTNCAEYPAHPLVLERPAATDARDATGKGAEYGEHEERGIKSKIKRHLTQMELVPKIAMFQEVWSCPPGSQDNMDTFGASQNEPRRRTGANRWKRRAVLLWTFETVHSVSYTMRGKNELVTAPEGKGQWRFLTTLDPTSQSHQKQSLLSPGVIPGSGMPTAIQHHHQHHQHHQHLARDAVMSPTPSYQQHLSASMSENFALAWEATSGGSMPTYPSAVFPHGLGQPSSHHGAQGLYQQPAAATTTTGAPVQSALDSFSSHGGLATPPPTASLAGSFTHHQHHQHQHHQHHQHQHHGFGAAQHNAHSGAAPGSDQAALGFMTAVTSAGMDGGNALVAGPASVADQFLSAAAESGGFGVSVGVYDDVVGGGGGGGGGGPLQGWDMSGMPAMDARLVGGHHQHQHHQQQQWSPNYPPTTSASAAAAGVLDWAAAPPTRSGGGGVKAGSPSSPPGMQRHGEAATAVGMEAIDERDGWGATKPTRGSDGPDRGQESFVPSPPSAAGVAVESLAQECAGAELVPGETEAEQQQQQIYDDDTQETLVRLEKGKRGLKRSRADSVGDRENDPPRHGAKMARYSNTPAEEIDWDGVSGRGGVP